MLAKHPPFADEADQERLIRKVRSCQHEGLPVANKLFYSEALQDLLNQLVVSDPDQRLAPEKIMEFDFMINAANQSPLTDSKASEQYISPKR